MSPSRLVASRCFSSVNVAELWCAQFQPKICPNSSADSYFSVNRHTNLQFTAKVKPESASRVKRYVITQESNMKKKYIIDYHHLDKNVPILQKHELQPELQVRNTSPLFPQNLWYRWERGSRRGETSQCLMNDEYPAGKLRGL